MSNFDDHFKNFDKQFEQTRKFVFGAFIVNAILGLGIIGAVVWVADHFLKKYW